MPAPGYLGAAGGSAAGGGLGAFLGPIGWGASILGALFGGGGEDQKFIDQTMKPNVPQMPQQQAEEQPPPPVQNIPTTQLMAALEYYQQNGVWPPWFQPVSALRGYG